MISSMDRISWKTEWQITKFKDPTDRIARLLRAGMKIEDAVKAFPAHFLGIVKWEKNVALDEGLQEIIDIIIGAGSPILYDHDNARIGVGDTASPSPMHTQTGLQAPTNKTWNAMDTSYPSRSGQIAEWRSTFGANDANYAWEEYTVVNASSDSGKNLNRCTSSKGTKTSGEVWTLSVKITFS